jgi:hypothetical protein
MSAGVRFRVALATRQPLAVAVFTNKPTITVRGMPGPEWG